MDAGAPTPDWFHVGVIAPPGYDPPGFEAHVATTLAKLLGPKSRAHKIGILSTWAEPVGNAVTDSAAANGWHSAGHAVDRMSGDAGWIRCWLQIAAASEALVVFGPTTPAMEVVLELCGRIGCCVRQAAGCRHSGPAFLGELTAGPTTSASISSEG